jgi:hypothetical protein
MITFLARHIRLYRIGEKKVLESVLWHFSKNWQHGSSDVLICFGMGTAYITSAHDVQLELANRS